MSTTRVFDKIDSAILTEIQKQFPIVHRPFLALGEKIDISEEECLERVSRLKSDRVIRQLSAVFDTRSLGYQSSLVAMRIDPDYLDEAAEIINKHPGVSHNYARDDSFNLWFTIAVPPTDSLEKVVNIFHALAKSKDTIILPTLKLYKIGVKLDLTDSGELWENQADIYDEKRSTTSRPPLTKYDIKLIRIMQDDLPLLEIPYAVWAEQADTTEEEIFSWAADMERLGYMRRFAAILHHRNAGFAYNAMVVWQVPAQQVDAVGENIARFREVSHCYRRPVYPNWPYSLFTMIHAQSYPACLEVLKRIEDNVGSFPHKSLLSTKEYKKARVKYFSPALDEWWKEFGSKVNLE